MAKVPTSIPVSDLGQGAASVLNSLKNSTEPIFITQSGEATAVLMSLEAYERTESDREILVLLARGEREIVAGVGHSLDEILADAIRAKLAGRTFDDSAALIREDRDR